MRLLNFFSKNLIEKSLNAYRSFLFKKLKALKKTKKNLKTCKVK